VAKQAKQARVDPKKQELLARGTDASDDDLIFVEDAPTNVTLMHRDRAHMSFIFRQRFTGLCDDFDLGTVSSQLTSGSSMAAFSSLVSDHNPTLNAMFESVRARHTFKIVKTGVFAVEPAALESTICRLAGSRGDMKDVLALMPEQWLTHTNIDIVSAMFNIANASKVSALLRKGHVFDRERGVLSDEGASEFAPAYMMSTVDVQLVTGSDVQRRYQYIATDLSIWMVSYRFVANNTVGAVCFPGAGALTRKDHYSRSSLSSITIL
jgi:ATP-dependent protease HslVU (ClpYQ) peptidase subunit